MTIFLKGRKLWRYVTGSIPKLVPTLKSKAIAVEDASKTTITADDYEERLEEWETNRYNCNNDSSLDFYIELKIYQMRQETGQSIFDFYSQTSTMWEQLSVTDPPLVCSKNIELFVKYQDRRKFMHFMMGLREDFEPTSASLLSRSPTPSLDAAVKELISEENCRPTHHMSSFDHVLATPSPQPPIAAFIAPP
ncbi:hypothetical protein RGQ29_011274 [Quercus rubra]|uniref:Retrotransposon gag domain-containing protein n=1 Tax=Quercus rubra TaxID=3512 RepID=A0AAN7G4T0_QUERU|nr:hypothetical protein RGQ29_011274 [Quercus rubra]